MDADMDVNDVSAYDILKGYLRGLLPDTWIAGCACAGNAENVFPATADKRYQYASRHVRHVHDVMHAGIAN